VEAGAVSSGAAAAELGDTCGHRRCSVLFESANYFLPLAKMATGSAISIEVDRPLIDDDRVRTSSCGIPWGKRMKMSYALVNGLRQEAEPKLRGTCPNCGREVVAKCGQQRIWHWSHLGKLECDRWWEPETEWHRTWKALFPQEWQEVIHVAGDGERHIADVKNGTGWVIELQHSSISPEERLSRENFYKTMVWVVDGLRYKRDLAAFRKAVAESYIVKDNPLYLSPLNGGTGLFRRWAPLRCPVFVDFGDEQFHIEGFVAPGAVLWQFLLHPQTRRVVIAPSTRESFIAFCLKGSGLQHLFAKRHLPPPQMRYRRKRRQF
jgi:competence protein CoiA